MNATARIILLALPMHLIYQLLVLKTLYPNGAVVIAMLLAFRPYLLIRELVVPSHKLGDSGYSPISNHHTLAFCSRRERAFPLLAWPTHECGLKQCRGHKRTRERKRQQLAHARNAGMRREPEAAKRGCRHHCTEKHRVRQA